MTIVMLATYRDFKILIDLVKQNFERKIYIFPYLSVKICVLGSQKNRLDETVLLSTHSIRLG